MTKIIEMTLFSLFTEQAQYLPDCRVQSSANWDQTTEYLQGFHDNLIKYLPTSEIAFRQSSWRAW